VKPLKPDRARDKGSDHVSPKHDGARISKSQPATADKKPLGRAIRTIGAVGATLNERLEMEREANKQVG